jgi:hypothetical protein
MHLPLPRAQLGSRAVEGFPALTSIRLAESLYVLAFCGSAKTLFRFRRRDPPLEKSLENMHCLRCNRNLETGHKSVAVYMFAQTVGIKPRQKSAAHRISFCPQCSVSLAMGPPPEGALNLAAWDMIRDLVGSDPALNQAAWESLSGVLGLLSATGTDGAPRSVQAGRYFEF